MTKQQFNILVTGGAGNIGTNLCNELRSRGHHVVQQTFITLNEMTILDATCVITDNYKMGR